MTGSGSCGGAFLHVFVSGVFCQCRRLAACVCHSRQFSPTRGMKSNEEAGTEWERREGKREREKERERERGGEKREISCGCGCSIYVHARVCAYVCTLHMLAYWIFKGASASDVKSCPHILYTLGRFIFHRTHLFSGFSELIPCHGM